MIYMYIHDIYVYMKSVRIQRYSGPDAEKYGPE